MTTGTEDLNPQRQEGEVETIDLDSWKGAIPEELRGEKSLSSFKDDAEGFAHVVKSYIEGQRMIGGSVKIPGEQANDEERGAFFTKLGRPETVAGYLEGFNRPEDMDADDPMEKEFLATAHKYGLSKSQVHGILQWAGEFGRGNIGEQNKQYEETKALLVKDWGGAYDSNVGMAFQAARQFGGEEFMKFLDDSGAGNHPLFLKTFARIGKALVEADVISGEATGMSDESIMAKIKELKGEPGKSPFWNDRDPRHKDVVDEVNKLYEQLYPSI